MNVFRIYTDKHTGIASGIYQSISESNSNVANLFYGGGGTSTDTSTAKRNAFSRHLLHIDLTDLKSRLNSFEINSAYTVSYKLKLKNSVPSDKILEPEFEFNVLEKQIASSFDLICFQIDREFNAGRGSDFDETLYLVKQSNVDFALTGFSNFLSASTTVGWNGPGVFIDPTGSTSYAIQSFQTGGEDIAFDVTTMIQNILNSGGTSANFGICYGRTWELASGNTRYISSFYTDKTNTYYKPYLELTYNQAIRDDRHQVVNNRNSRLFLYLFSGNTPVNYYSAGTISVKNSSNAYIATGIVPTHHSKGVYYFDILMSGTTKGQKFTDVWSGITFVPGVDQTDFVQTFQIRDNFYTNNARETNDFVVDVYGLENNDIIQTGELRRVYFNTRVAYSTNHPFVDYGLEYKLDLFSGTDNIVPWTSVNNIIIDGCLKSFVDVDSSWLLDGQSYKITLRINELGTKKVLPDPVVFRVQNPIS